MPKGVSLCSGLLGIREGNEKVISHFIGNFQERIEHYLTIVHEGFKLDLSSDKDDILQDIVCSLLGYVKTDIIISDHISDEKYENMINRFILRSLIAVVQEKLLYQMNQTDIYKYLFVQSIKNSNNFDINSIDINFINNQVYKNSIDPNNKDLFRITSKELEYYQTLDEKYHDYNKIYA